MIVLGDDGSWRKSGKVRQGNQPISAGSAERGALMCLEA